METLLKVEDVSQLIGVTKFTVYQLVYKKAIPCLKLTGKMLRFRKSDIEAWLEDKSQPIRQLPTKPETRGRSKRAGNRATNIDRIIESAKQDALKGGE